jgi:hypothetical protein
VQHLSIATKHTLTLLLLLLLLLLLFVLCLLAFVCCSWASRWKLSSR